MVVGWSDFAMGLAPATRREGNPDGVAAGQCATHPQQTKHFQRGSATVLCTTVNLRAVFYCAAFLRSHRTTGCEVSGRLPHSVRPPARWGDRRAGEADWPAAQRAIAPE